MKHRLCQRIIVPAILLVPVAMLLTELQSHLTLSHETGSTCFNLYVQDALSPFASARPLARWLLIGGGALLNRPPLAVNFWLQALSIYASLVIMTCMGMHYFRNRATALLGTFIAVAWMSFTFLWLGYGISYPYDFPALLFSAAGMYAIARRNFVLLMVVVAIGGLNKETTLWLLPAWFLCTYPEMRERRRLMLAQSILLAVAFTVSYLIPRAILHSGAPVVSFTSITPDGTASSRLADNMRELLFLNRGGIRLNVYWSFAVHLIALLGWKRFPADFKRMYPAAILFHAVPMFLAGNIWETRLFNEILPLGALGAAMALADGHPVLTGGSGEKTPCAPQATF